MAKEWFVLALADTGADLLRCTPKGFESLPMNAEAMGSHGTQLDNEVAESVTTEGGRYVPTDSGHQTSDAVPRATFTNNDVAMRGADTEQYLTSVSQAVRQHMEARSGPLFVTMDPSRWALFQTVSGLDTLPERLDAVPQNASAQQLWELSKERVVQ